MRYKPITDFIDFFEDRDSQWVETITETVNLVEKLENDCYHQTQYDRILKLENCPGSYMDIKYCYDESDKRLSIDHAGKLCYLGGEDDSPCMCTISYKTYSKKLSDFLSALYACFVKKQKTDFGNEYVDIDDSSMLTDAGYKMLIKSVKCLPDKEKAIDNLNLNLDEIKDFLCVFAKTTLEYKVEICESHIIAPILKRLKELDKTEPDKKRTTHFIHFHCNSQWCLALDVIIERKLDGSITVEQLWQDRATWQKKYMTFQHWTQKDFDEFLAKLKEFDVENWEEVLSNNNVADAPGWQYVQCGEEMPAFSCGAYAAFPKRFNELKHLFETFTRPTDLYDMRRYKRACKYFEKSTLNCILTNKHCEGGEGCENFMWLKNIDF